MLKTGTVVRQVVYDKLPVDTKVLCDIFEYFCGSFVVSMNIQSKGFLHGVVLPRSWLLVLLRNVEECNSRDTRLFRLLLDPLAELSTQIDLTGLRFAWSCRLFDDVLLIFSRPRL
jgi:hypothetical protein